MQNSQFRDEFFSLKIFCTEDPECISVAQQEIILACQIYWLAILAEISGKLIVANEIHEKNDSSQKHTHTHIYVHIKSGPKFITVP